MPRVLGGALFAVFVAGLVAALLGPGSTNPRPTNAAFVDDTTTSTTVEAATTTTTAPPPTTTTVAPAPRRPLRVAFFGDSVAWTTAAAVAPYAGHYGITVLNEGIWGCGVVRGTPFRYFGAVHGILPNDCDHWPEQWQAAVDRDRPDVAVVMTGRWELMDRVFEGRWTGVGDDAFHRYLAGEFDRAISVARSTGATVLVATTPYYRRGEAPGGGKWPEDVPARVDLVNRLLRQAASRNGVGVVDFGGMLSPGGALAMEIDGVRIRTDGVHVAVEAGPWISPRLLPAIRSAVGA